MSKAVTGFNQFKGRMELNAIAGAALRTFFSAYGQLLTVEAKRNAPRWKGNLRGSITFKHVGIGGFPDGIDLFSRAPYALKVHGNFNANVNLKEPWSRSKPSHVPVSELREWSRDHDISPYVVQKAIAKRGTPIIPFFKIAINNTEPEKKLLLAGTALKMETKWKAGRMTVKQ
tara:strand:+ start:1037 stop:1555 length:519 start_codon:yes stop_codon:yes gene_type:complete